VNALDVLELELRRLPSVAFVGLQERADVLVVQVLSLANADPDALRAASERICRSHLDRPFAVELAGGSRPSRIRLLDVSVLDDEVEVHLGYEGVHTVGRAKGFDPTAAASATFEALQRLGAKVPFEVEAAALFEHVLGEGVMLVLGSESAGERYGVAAAPNVPQAAVRATLHALNRYLSTQTLPATA
jgi:hypothetical protein